MLLAESSRNLDSLNNCFTENEFDFIYHTVLENPKLNTQFIKESNALELIKYLQNYVENFDISLTNTSLSQDALLNQINLITKKIYKNISLINTLKSHFSILYNKYFELLLQFEILSQNPDSEKIKKFKHDINVASKTSEKIYAQIQANDIEIDSLFKQDYIKKYLSDFYASNPEITPKQYEPLYTPQASIEESNEMLSSNKKSDKIVSSKSPVLRISEKDNKVFLPYTKKEIAKYLKQFPNAYTSFRDVINKEFILPLDYYMKFPAAARFRETYSLIRDREAKSMLDALKYSLNIMLNQSLNPAIIAACKTQSQLEHYLSCLERNKLNEFKDFEIKFDVSPI